MEQNSKEQPVSQAFARDMQNALTGFRQATAEAFSWYTDYSLIYVGEDDDPGWSTDREHNLCDEIYPVLQELDGELHVLSSVAKKRMGIKVPDAVVDDPAPWAPDPDGDYSTVPGGLADIVRCPAMDRARDALQRCARDHRAFTDILLMPALAHSCRKIIALAGKLDALADEVCSEAEKDPCKENAVRIEKGEPLQTA